MNLRQLKLILLLLLPVLSCTGEQVAPKPKKVVSPYGLRTARDSAYQAGYSRGYSLGWSVGWSTGYNSHFCFR